jgi:hypothetical protein
VADGVGVQREDTVGMRIQIYLFLVRLAGIVDFEQVGGLGGGGGAKYATFVPRVTLDIAEPLPSAI